MAQWNSNGNGNVNVDVEDDPYGFILDLAYISHSQEEILRNAPFVEPHAYPPNDPIFMVSTPDIHDLHLPNHSDFEFSETQLSDLDVSPPQKSQLSGACLGVQSQEVEEAVGKLGSAENETVGVVEASGTKKKTHQEPQLRL